MTWDEIYERADDCPCGSPELRAKDNARWQVRKLVLEKENIDIENAECPEEEVDYYSGLWNIRFDNYGSISYYEIA